MFSTDVFIKIWDVVDKGNYYEVDCSSSKKNRQTGAYETDFSCKFVRFIGEAYRKHPAKGERVKLTSCGVQNCYERDGQKQFLKNPTFLVFDFERDGENTYSAPPRNENPKDYVPAEYLGGNGGEKFESVVEDDNLPF